MDKDGNKDDPKTTLPYHKVGWDDVWFKALDLGDEFTLTKAFPRHFKASHGFMGQVIHTKTGTVFHIQSASADSSQRLMAMGNVPLYPDAV
jgi:hypothetical protein